MTAPAQETVVVKDLQLWTGVKIEKTFLKDWTLSLEEEIRFKTNVSEINNFFTELGLRYRINKNFALGTAFRYTSDKNSLNQYDPLARYHFDLRYRGKLDFLSIQYRFRYQREVEGMNFFDPNTLNEKLFRNRFRVKLNSLEIMEPYISAEILQEISPYVIPRLAYWRFVVGADLDAGDFGEFRVAWGFNRELGKDLPAMIYMFRVNYTYKF